MIAIQRTLCPIDFSEFSKPAVEQAVALARWYEARVDLLHVAAINGRPGRGALDLGLFGSTASDVLRRANCPVLTVRTL
ncbi:MAG: universal stress protein [Acidobacteria bacterium]|nr:universal stress protein [Acidobacteriota bacterium]